MGTNGIIRNPTTIVAIHATPMILRRFAMSQGPRVRVRKARSLAQAAGSNLGSCGSAANNSQPHTQLQQP